MKKYVLFLISVIIYISCRSGLYKVSPNYIHKIKNNEKLKVDVKSFSLEEFDTYVYNICELIGEEINNDRFCDCPEDFFQIAEEKEFIKKVEEVYLLKHKHTDLVFYLTTMSHKYIQPKSGFLNERKYYENKIVLDQIEYIYIGQFEENNNWIFFANPKNNKDIILHYNEHTFPKELEIITANIATSENKYEIYEPINLTDSVFKNPLIYKLNNNYNIDFYENKNRIRGARKETDSIHIISKKGEIEIVFTPKDTSKLGYKLTGKRIRYRPNYFLIPKS